MLIKKHLISATLKNPINSISPHSPRSNTFISSERSWRWPRGNKLAPGQDFINALQWSLTRLLSMINDQTIKSACNLNWCTLSVEETQICHITIISIQRLIWTKHACNSRTMIHLLISTVDFPNTWVSKICASSKLRPT